jgi:DnaJ-domain-containing protein 1
MNLPGRLDGTTLGDLLGTLHRDRATGILELVEWSGATAGRVHRVHLSGGLVARVETALRAPRLGEVLHREGFLSDADRRVLAWRLASSPGSRCGEVLVREGLATPDVVSAALRWQQRTRLDALEELRTARVRFRVARPESREERSVPLSPREFLYGRSRARDRARANAQGHAGYASRGAPHGRTPNGARAEPAEAARPAEDPRRVRALALLGLAATADGAAVKSAFRRLASQTHPDRFPSATPAERARLIRRFAELSAAYHELVA